jgi:flavorubredoxin
MAGTRIDEIADGIFRLSTLVPDAAASHGLTFNQFLIRAEQPLLFHTGHRAMFGQVAEAVGRVLPVHTLRWITFGHLEADECGSMNQWLAAAPGATVAHGELGNAVSFNDLADRPPRSLADGEVLDLGGRRVRHIDTPHVPHGWEARLLFEETTSTLLCGDLFTQAGDGPAITGRDLVGAAVEAEAMFGYTCSTPRLAATARTLAALAPATLACMHGSSFAGDGAAALRELASSYEERFPAAPPGAPGLPASSGLAQPVGGEELPGLIGGPRPDGATLPLR